MKIIYGQLARKQTSPEICKIMTIFVIAANNNPATLGKRLL